MDLRTQKTRRALRETFLQLLAKKPLERITVKELTEQAEISKATFYLHYRDIFDLCEQLQQEVIETTIARISPPEAFLTDPLHFMQETVAAFYSQRSVTQLLFSGTQSAVFPARIAEAYRHYYAQQFPHLTDDTAFQTFLTYQVYGAYYAFTENYPHFGREPVLQAIHDLSGALTGARAYQQAFTGGTR